MPKYCQKCGKELPQSTRGKYCQNCQRRSDGKLKAVLTTAASAALLAGGTVISIALRGKKL